MTAGGGAAGNLMWPSMVAVPEPLFVASTAAGRHMKKDAANLFNAWRKMATRRPGECAFM